jgi:hypothetical protein
MDKKIKVPFLAKLSAKFLVLICGLTPEPMVNMASKNLYAQALSKGQ